MEYYLYLKNKEIPVLEVYVNRIINTSDYYKDLDFLEKLLIEILISKLY